MGTIVGAALVSHVPPLVMAEQDRRDLNGGVDTTLYAGLHQLNAEKLRPLEADTVIVLDSHWFTTIEFVVSSHERRQGFFTSDELPRGMSSMPYDLTGDPELANAWALASQSRDDMWVTAIDNPHLPIHYPTVNLLPFLQNDERWVSASICQTAQTPDFLLYGQLLGETIAASDRRVVLLASGGLSHRFWPLQEFRDHEGADPDLHLITPEARDADRVVIQQLLDGDHAAVIAGMPAYLKHAPEGRFGHYLAMVGALGGADCTARGTQYGEYEAVSGTGQAHIWFDV